MATHDYVIDNQSAPAFRADLNNALQAIVTQNSNATAPATTYANMVWYDTANNQLKKRNEADSGWITLGTIDEGLGTFTPSGQVVVDVLGTIAAASAGAVGTYAFLSLTAAATTTFVFGTNYAGSGLAPVGYASAGLTTSNAAVLGGSGATQSGTWKCMGTVSTTSSFFKHTLFLRVA